jgi:hypothetical protein
MLARWPKSLLSLAMGSCWIVSCRAVDPGASAPPSATPTAPPSEAAPQASTFAGNFSGTFVPPNLPLPVTATAGTCPDTVDLWALSLGFEGGADHTVVVDFPAIATGPTTWISAADRRLTYSAPLREAFSTCVGTATSAAVAMYSVRFDDGTVHFTLDLAGRNGTFDIRYADLSVNRPYLYWRATE